MLERLVKCRLCGGNVSSTAFKCPHCGTSNFKSDSFLRIEKAAKAEELLRSRGESYRRKFIQDGFINFFNPEDEHIIRLFLPNAVKIFLQLRVHTSKSVDYASYPYGFSLSLDNKGISYKEGQPYEKGLPLFVGTGKHRMRISFERSSTLSHKGYVDSREIDITIDKSTRFILIDCSLHEEFWSQVLRMKEARIYTK